MGILEDIRNPQWHDPDIQNPLNAYNKGLRTMQENRLYEQEIELNKLRRSGQQYKLDEYMAGRGTRDLEREARGLQAERTLSPEQQQRYELEQDVAIQTSKQALDPELQAKAAQDAEELRVKTLEKLDSETKKNISASAKNEAEAQWKRDESQRKHVKIAAQDMDTALRGIGRAMEVEGTVGALTRFQASLPAIQTYVASTESTEDDAQVEAILQIDVGTPEGEQQFKSIMTALQYGSESFLDHLDKMELEGTKATGKAKGKPSDKRLSGVDKQTFDTRMDEHEGWNVGEEATPLRDTAKQGFQDTFNAFHSTGRDVNKGELGKAIVDAGATYITDVPGAWDNVDLANFDIAIEALHDDILARPDDDPSMIIEEWLANQL